MSEFRADLHCHSTCSDGSLSPEQLVIHAKEIGLQGLAITDHDTIASYPEVFEIGKEQGIEIIPGVEYSASHRDVSVHVLGYGFDVKNEGVLALCSAHKERREKRNDRILKKLADHGMPLKKEEILFETTMGRPHIAKALIKKGYVASLQEAFNRYIGDRKPCHVRGEPIEVKETIETIHAAGGFAVIAHPHLIKDAGIVANLLEMDFDGIECYYAFMSDDKNRDWKKKAEKRGWLVTGGSDFHGEDIKPKNPLGISWIGEETFRKLQAGR